MIKTLAILILFITGLDCLAQDAKNKAIYGIQVNGKFTGMNAFNNRNGYYMVSSGEMGRGYDIVVHIDKPGAKWYGMGTGLGLSTIGIRSWGGKQMYYAVMPLRLQIKLGIVWFEPGLENRLFLGAENVGPDYIDKQTFQRYHLAGNFGLRFKLFRGLSVNAGLSTGITPAIDFEGTDQEVFYGDAYFNPIAAFIGVRYMFNQLY